LLLPMGGSKSGRGEFSPLKQRSASSLPLRKGNFRYASEMKKIVMGRVLRQKFSSDRPHYTYPWLLTAPKSGDSIELPMLLP